MRNVSGSVAVGEQPIVPNGMEALRQHVDQEAPDELVGRQRHRFVAGPSRVFAWFGIVRGVCGASREAVIRHEKLQAERDSNERKSRAHLGSHELH